MPVHILDAMAREGFEEVVAWSDPRSGLRAFLALHDTSVGPAFGGIRRHAYGSERFALQDCLRLALAMAWKIALADIPGGGAKLVLLDHADLDREAAYRFIGRAVERLDGRYYTGPDVGTGYEELAWVAGETRFTAQPGDGGSGDLAGATMLGAFAGIRAALIALDGAPDWPRRTFVVQGLGEVGLRLARQLCGLGARVVATDVDEERAARARAEIGLEIVATGAEFDVPCDVFAPCALGGVLHDLTIQRLACRAVVGAANNILAHGRHGERLDLRGILYVPDFVVNAGAVIRGSSYHARGVPASDEEVLERVGALVERILAQAASEGRTPSAVAVESARRRIAERRAAVAQA